MQGRKRTRAWETHPSVVFGRLDCPAHQHSHACAQVGPAAAGYSRGSRGCVISEGLQTPAPGLLHPKTCTCIQCTCAAARRK